MRRRAAVLCLAATAVGLAGCASSTERAALPTSSPTAPSSSTSSSSAPPTTAPAPSTSAAPRSSTAPPTHSAPAHPTEPRSTCSSLSIMVFRGSGIAGREFAALQFTNTGDSPCTLYGYPTVTLSLHGREIGTVSQPASSALSSRRLAPGDVAESRLDDLVMNCQGNLSDTIRVTAPGSSQTATATVQLRACPLQVEALGAPE